MKTNRRGFFGALVGLVGGVVAAFTGKDVMALTKPVDVTTFTAKTGGCDGLEIEMDWIQITFPKEKSASIEYLGDDWFHVELTYQKGDEFFVREIRGDSIELSDWEIRDDC